MSKEPKRPLEPIPTIQCSGPMRIPTDEELRALKAMRAVKERVRVLKAQLAELEEDGRHGNMPERLRLEQELDGLKKEWYRLEDKWKTAARARMILLGHEEA